MSAKLRVGVIGTGFGKSLVRAFGGHPRAEVTALCGFDPARTAQVAAELGVPRAYADYHRMFQEAPIDAVVVAAPPNLHRPVALAALDAGKHVLCAKPLAGTLEDATAMVKRAHASGLVHGIDQQFRLAPAAQRAKELVDAGAIGRPLSLVDSICINTWAYHAEPSSSPHKRSWFTSRDGAGGFILSSAQHFYDRLLWLFGPICAATGWTHTALPELQLADGSVVQSDAPDAAHAVLSFSSGVVGLARLSPQAWGAFPHSRLEVHGDAGSFLLEGPPGDPSLSVAERGARQYVGVTLPEPEPVPAGVGLATFRSVDRFVRSVLDDEPMSPTFEDGYRSQEIIEAVLRSSQTGARVGLPIEPSRE